MTKRINDFIDVTDYHPTAQDGYEPPIIKTYQCPKCSTLFFEECPKKCSCGFEHLTKEERIEFLEDTVEMLTKSLSELTEMVVTLVTKKE